MRRTRRGFTLLEILVAISIILILIGVVFIGFGTVGTGQQINQTRSTLAIAENALAETKAVWQSTGKAGTELYPTRNEWRWGNDLRTPPLPLNFWMAQELSGSDPVAIPAPASVAAGADDRTAHFAVTNTAIAFSAMYRVNSARTMLGNLPSNQMMNVADSGVTPNVDESEHPILLDAWDNPIILVHGGGLEVEIEADNGGKTVIRRPGNGPFFASAGPDGNFTAGDDNIYSFEN